ncbi:MAG: protein nirF, partial [Roseibium sp.]|nr:protein nirF [Roseibium sp.]
MKWLGSTFLAIFMAASAQAEDIVTTGDLGLVVERASGSLLLVDQSERSSIARIE